MAWTNAQIKAIETKDKTLLISAAAGSGKTTVLIERIIRSLTDLDDPADISRILVVTFTRAAASELKQRISKALSKALAENPNNKKLFSQLSKLGSASISTIDSFYGDVVRQHSQLLGIPASLRVSDGSDLLKIQRRIMNEVIDMGYAGELSVSVKEFASCADALSDMRNDSKLFEVFYSLYRKLLNHPQGITVLLEYADAYESMESIDFFESKYGKIIKDHVQSKLEFFVRFLTDALDYFSAYSDKVKRPFEDDLSFCLKALNIIESDDYAALRAHFTTYPSTAISRPKDDDLTEKAAYFCDTRNETVKEKLNDLKSVYFGEGFSQTELQLFAKESASKCRTLYAVLSRFDELYMAEKLSQNICEFNDIKLWAYKLLVNDLGEPTELATSISEKFDTVYIDEYQDVDSVQDLIFKAISKPKGRFMVGDVKQSIYGFRGAEPSLFMDYRNEFANIDPQSDVLPEKDDCTIFMSDNFRCDESIIDFANEVCSYIFKNGSSSITYKDEDDLHFSKQVDPDHKSSKIAVRLIDRKNATVEIEDAEAAYIASEISKLISNGTKSDGSPIVPGDIAILTRDAKPHPKIGKALDKYGIKHSANGESDLFADPEVSIVVSILNVIDNPMRDIHLAALLMSPIFNFTADMLVKIQNEPKENVCSLFDALSAYASFDGELAEKCRSFINDINELRDISRALPADKIVKHVFSKFSFISRGNANGSSDALIRLYDNARSYEGDVFKGLYSYVKYLQDMIDNNKSPEKKGDGAPDEVHLMTMHKSKGLEFPVCFVSCCHKSFSVEDLKGQFLYSSRLGIATDMVDETGFGKIKTPYRKALHRHIHDELSEEEMRILYVALTRARERLYVTADPQYGVQRELDIAYTARKYGGRSAILDSRSHLSWVLTALNGSNKEGSTFDIEVIPYEDIEPLPEDVSENDASTAINTEIDESIFKEISENLDYEYPYLHIANLPAKLSVSKLSPNILDRTEESEEIQAEEIDIRLPKLVSTPSFMGGTQKTSAAEKGTATHTFLQFCDFDLVEQHGVKKELERLVKLRFMSDEMGRIVSVKQIEAFFKSDLYKSIRHARKLYREQRFNILLPAKNFTEDEAYSELIKDEKILVQGVIDIFFEDESGNLILCDYKTDYLTPDELTDKALAKKKLSEAHSRQLSYYAEALCEMLGKRPDKVLIYSLPLGDSVEISI